MRKSLIILLAILSIPTILILLILFNYTSGLDKQEGNILYVLKSITRISSSSPCVKFSDVPLKYIMRVSDFEKCEEIVEKDNNLIFDSQMGGGVFFHNLDNTPIYGETRAYTSYFQVIEIQEEYKSSKH
ncbi:MAG: hypothetical protein WCK31_01925 [bacterium]